MINVAENSERLSTEKRLLEMVMGAGGGGWMSTDIKMFSGETLKIKSASLRIDISLQ